MKARTIPAPWYRQRWPWILIAGPAIVVIAGFATLMLAIRSDDGVVADDYYKRGLGINRTIERAERAAESGIVALVDVAADGTVTVRIDGQGPLAKPPSVRLTLARPAHAGEDRAVTLQRGADGRYAGRLAPPAPGRWQLVVETDAWRLPSVETTAPLAGVALRAESSR
jgi:hypothetical protein